jgi:hypothetical protein
MKYRKKPIVVEAYMFAGGAKEPGWPDGWLSVQHSYSLNGESLGIYTLEGIHYANKGDWIIKGIVNEFYPCKANIFMATYEEVG